MSVDTLPPRTRASAAAALGLALVIIGGSTFNILPLLTAGAADKLGFSAQQAGVLSSFLTVASGLSALLAGFWVRSLSWSRAAAAALGGMSLFLFAALGVHGYWLFVSLQGAAAFFASAAFSLGMTIISDGHESTRGFGTAISAQAAYQIAALWAGPMLLRASGLNGVLALLAVPAALAVLVTPLLPARGRSIPSEHRSGLLRGATLLAFAGFTCFFVGAGAYWTYIELMGQSQGMSSRVIADCVALSVAAGIPGGLLASAQGRRFGSLWPLTFAASLMLIAALLLDTAPGALAFGAAGILYYFAWCYSLAYQFTLVNTVDATGRAVALTGACAFFGSAAGAALAAPFVTPNDYRAVVWIVAAAAAISVALYALASLIHERAARAAGLAKPGDPAAAEGASLGGEDDVGAR
ncbi:MAG TPA: MFS transporter [Steroidobacteraceae bacterium]|nr:MFS transporter [Steroidobacteraceae bacterium]